MWQAQAQSPQASLQYRLEACRAQVAARCPVLATSSLPAVTLFLTVAQGRGQPASVWHAAADDFDTAWALLLSRVPGTDSGPQAQAGGGDGFRVEWVSQVRSLPLATLDQELAQQKPGYVRHGLALDAGFEMAFTAQEINAHGMLAGRLQPGRSVLNRFHFSSHLLERFAQADPLALLQPDRRVHQLGLQGVYVDRLGVMHVLDAQPLHRGRRAVKQLDEPLVLQMLQTATNHLLEQVDADGLLAAGVLPRSGKPLPALTRRQQAEAMWGLAEACAHLAQPHAAATLARSSQTLLRRWVRPYVAADGQRVAYCCNEDGQPDAATSALALLALTTGAGGVASSLLPQLGAGLQVLAPQARRLPAAARREAQALAVMAWVRLYERSQDAYWLSLATQTYDEALQALRTPLPDRWWGQASLALLRHRPSQSRWRFALQQAEEELCCAAGAGLCAARILSAFVLSQSLTRALPAVQGSGDGCPQPADALSQTLATLQQAAEQALLDSFFWPEQAMGFGTHEGVVGAFYNAAEDFRVRSDEVARHLQACLIWLHAARPSHHPMPVIGLPQADIPPVADVAALAGWPDEAEAEPPQRGPVAAVAQTWPTWPPSARVGAFDRVPAAQAVDRARPTAGALVAVAAAPKAGIAGASGPRPAQDGAGLVLAVGAAPASPADGLRQLRIPAVLSAPVSAGLGGHVLDAGAQARRDFFGDVVGVTGSVGKTSVVAMLGAALRTLDSAACTGSDVSLPLDVAAEMARMPHDVSCWVIEMALDGMLAQAQLVRPTVAVVTAIAPAKLSRHGSMELIARKASAVFGHMRQGGWAVLRRDMPHYREVERAAEAHGLRVLSFGWHDEADIRLLAAGNGQVRARAHGEAFSFALALQGRHMAINALAVVAVLQALELPWPMALATLGSLRALPGRGQRFAVATQDGGQAQVTDETASACPASMQAALLVLGQAPCAPRQRVVVLGDMSELGEEAQDYHLALEQELLEAGVGRALLVGPLMRTLHLRLQEHMPSFWYASPQALARASKRALHDGDWVLVKGGAASGMAAVLAQLRPQD